MRGWADDLRVTSRSYAYTFVENVGRASERKRRLKQAEWLFLSMEPVWWGTQPLAPPVIRRGSATGNTCNSVAAWLSQPPPSQSAALGELPRGSSWVFCSIFGTDSFQKYCFLEVQKGLLGEARQSLLVRKMHFKEVKQKAETYSGTPGLPDATSPGGSPGRMSHQDMWHWPGLQRGPSSP